MLPESTIAATTPFARGTRARLARVAQGISLVTFLSAAACMVLAGALHSAGRDDTSAMLATVGYALAVAGIAAGVLSLALDSSADSDTPQETP